MLDFRSDTVTKPSQGMMEAMTQARVGDCGYGEDPATNELEQYCAEILGTEDSVFLTSGTLSNQIALMIHTRPGDEVILDQSYHLNTYESGACAQFAHVALNTVECRDGVMTAADVDEAFGKKRRETWCARPTLLELENTVHHHSGKALGPEQIAGVAEYAHGMGLRVHLDGARLFNACAAAQVDVRQYTTEVDTTSVCFSKGLGAPFGSALAGTREAMREARFYRKLFGAETRQSGFMAAAALYALQHNTGRLADDHELARYLASELRKLGIDLLTEAPDTNIVMVDTRALGVSARQFALLLSAHGLQVGAPAENLVRFVTHLDVSGPEAKSAISIVADVMCDLRPALAGKN
jgi:threonine aldolase